MDKPQLRVLVVEDSADDTELVVRLIKKGGYSVYHERVDTAQQMRDALKNNVWDIIISDYKMPGFSGIKALGILNECGLDIPFILVSGTIGEELAIEAMRKGANDYLMKDNLSRLVPAIEREIKECKIRTNERKAVSQLRESEEKYREMIELSPDSIVTVNLKGVVTSCNSAYEKFTGYSKEETIGKHFNKLPFLNMKDIPSYIKIFNDLLRNKKPTYLESTWINKDGTVHFGEIVIGIIKMQDKIMEFQAVTRDLTERKKMQQELLDGEEKFKSYVENAPEGIFISDQNGNYLEVNDAACKMTGYSKEELLRMKISDLVSPEGVEFEREHFGKVVKTGRASGTGPYLRKDGGKRHWIIEAVKLSEDRFLGFTKDITEWVLTEEKLSESELRHRELIENMVSGVAVYDAVDGGNDFVFKAMNKSGQKYSKVDINEIKGKRILEVFPGAKDIGLFGIFKRVYKTGKPEYLPTTLYKDERISQWVDNYVYKLPSGEIVAVYDDLTEKKKAEEQLIETQKLYWTIAENLPNGIVHIFDRNFRYLHNYGAELSRVGLTNEMLVGKSIHDVLPPEVAKLVEAKYKLVLKGESVSFEGDYGGVTFLVNAVPLRNSKEEVDRILVLSVNVTEKKKIEEKLIQSEEKYRELVENANSIISKSDKDGRIISMNEFGLKFFGYETEELIGKLWIETVLPKVESTGRVLENLTYDIVNDINKYGINLNENIKKNGERVWIYWTNKPIYNKKGELGGYLSVGTDITDKRLMEEKLIESEEKFRLAFDNANVGMCLVDLNGNFTKVNDKLCEILGYEKEELEGINTSNVTYVGDKKTGPEFIKNAIDGKSKSAIFEKRYIHKDGHIVWGQVSSSLVVGTNEVPLYFITQVQDITDRKKAEEDLKERENTLRSIFSSAPVGINLFKNRIWMWSNRGMEEIAGYEVNELVGKTPRFLYESDEEYERVGKILYKTPRDTEIIEVETKFVTKDGRIKNVNVRNSLLDINDPSKGHITVVLDTTERKKSEKQLGENLEYFAHLVDHIRNPLAIMSGFIQVEIENEKTKERLMRQIDRIEELIKQLDQGWMDTEETRRFLKKYY